MSEIDEPERGSGPTARAAWVKPLWKLLNTPFVLLLLSSVVLSGLGRIYSDRAAAEESEAERRAALSPLIAELDFRYSQLLQKKALLDQEDAMIREVLVKNTYIVTQQQDESVDDAISRYQWQHELLWEKDPAVVESKKDIAAIVTGSSSDALAGATNSHLLFLISRIEAYFADEISSERSMGSEVEAYLRDSYDIIPVSGDERTTPTTISEAALYLSDPKGGQPEDFFNIALIETYVLFRRTQFLKCGARQDTSTIFSFADAADRRRDCEQRIQPPTGHSTTERAGVLN